MKLQATTLVAVSILVMGTCAQTAQIPLKPGSNFIITNKSSQPYVLRLESLGTSEKMSEKFLDAYSTVTFPLASLSFFEVGTDQFHKSIFVYEAKTNMKNLRVMVIHYDLKRKELTLYGLGNYIKETINPVLPVDVMIVFGSGNEVQGEIKQPLNVQEQERITHGRVVPELSKQSEAEKLLEYQRK